MNRTGTTRSRPSNADAAVTSHAAKVSSASSGKSSQNRSGKARHLHVIGLAHLSNTAPAHAPAAQPNNLMNSRLFTRSNRIELLPPRSAPQYTHLARISQEATE
jgi:hypothetical protein